LEIDLFELSNFVSKRALPNGQWLSASREARGTIALHDDVTAPQFPGLFKIGTDFTSFCFSPIK
jgi:hypothetical protein